LSASQGAGKNSCLPFVSMTPAGDRADIAGIGHRHSLRAVLSVGSCRYSFPGKTARGIDGSKQASRRHRTGDIAFGNHPSTKPWRRDHRAA